MQKEIELLLKGNQFKLFVENRITEIRKNYDLRKIDIEILNYLSKCEDKNTSKDIQQVLLINKGYISQSVDRLKKDGYIIFVQDEKDRRFVHFLLTEKADPIIKDICEVWTKIFQTVFAGITEEELELMARLAKKIDDNMSDFLKDYN